MNVSIIIVNFNSFKLLDECLKSLFKQTNDVTFEVIIVDNNSAEGDIEGVIRKYNGVKLIKNEVNKGFAAANNQGLMSATGKYVLILNNDVFFLENAVKKVFDFAENTKEKMFVGIQLLNYDGTKQESVVEFPTVWNAITENLFLYKIFKHSKLFNKYYQNYNDYNEPIEVDVIRGAFMFCQKDELKALNGFDERFFFYSEETDLCYRFKKSGGKIIFLPNVKLVHYGGAAADQDQWFKFKNQAIGKIQFYQKHFNRIEFFAVIIIHWLGLLLRSFIFCIVGIISINKKLIMKGYFFFKQLLVYPRNIFNPPKAVED